MRTQAGFVTVDVHGKTKAQAKVAIEAALRRCDASVYRLRIIHGLNRGTELRTMLHAEYGGGDTRIRQVLAGENPGITELVHREL